MKFLLDESADYRLAKHLSQLGHDVTCIVKDYTRSVVDDKVLAISIDESHIIVTEDKEFISLATNSGVMFPGIIVFRLGHKDSLAIKTFLLDQVISELDSFDNLLVTILPAETIIRKNTIL